MRITKTKIEIYRDMVEKGYIAISFYNKERRLFTKYSEEHESNIHYIELFTIIDANKVFKNSDSDRFFMLINDIKKVFKSRYMLYCLEANPNDIKGTMSTYNKYCIPLNELNKHLKPVKTKNVKQIEKGLIKLFGEDLIFEIKNKNNYVRL